MVKKSMTVLLCLTFFSGCASNYQFGDISARYCTEQNDDLRAILKATLNSQGVSVGVDYCTAYTIANVVAGEENE